MADIRLDIAPDLIHNGVPQRLSDTIILNDRPKISILNHFNTLFLERNIIKAPHVASSSTTVNLYIKKDLLKRLHDRLATVETCTLPNITQLKEHIKNFFQNEQQPIFQTLINNEIGDEFIGVNTFGLSLFATSKSDAEQIERVQIETLTEGNITLKPFSSDGLEVILDDSYINLIVKTLGHDVQKLIEKCCKEVPAQLGILTDDVKVLINTGKLRIDGGYDYNCPSSTTDVTHYGGYDRFSRDVFELLNLFFNISLSIIPVAALKSVHVLEKELNRLDADKSLLEQTWSGVASFVESWKLKTKTKDDDKDELELTELSVVKTTNDGISKPVSCSDKKFIEWYKRSFTQSDKSIQFRRTEQVEMAKNSSDIIKKVKIHFPVQYFESVNYNGHEREVYVLTNKGDMTLDQYRKIGDVLNSIWKRGKTIAAQYFDYIRLGVEKAYHLSSVLMKKYNLTVDDIINFIDKGPSYLAGLDKIDDWSLISKLIITSILPNIIQAVYKTDPSNNVMNSVIISRANNLIKSDRDRLTKKYTIERTNATNNNHNETNTKVVCNKVVR
ncbi:major outer capsid protein [Mal de Rio Cuarto virus]|uniref:Major outer capsid protein n=1 Tax=Mal de Rio Cuarto virus TaxID=185954 RepID=Q4VVC1_9REOV|nr:major outer capsid protein [Mal de Rio Cuarto virus]AAU08742.1 major outer capsid protein [Mal de Rio Cuarto virus]